ncbi:MAG: diguanylate cyclase [Pseudomonadota bacterium]
MDMTRPAASVDARWRPRLRPAVQLLIVWVLLAFTAFATWQTQQLITTLQQTRFSNEVQRIDSAIEQRMVAYIQVLRGGLALFQSSDDVTRAEWSHFVETLRLGEHYPGFKNFTYAPVVRGEDLPAFLDKVRAEPPPPGMADPLLLQNFKLSFGGREVAAAPLHAPILYVAPFTPDNQLALGLDLMQEPMRRSMLEQAAASGDAVLSPRIRLMQRTNPVAGSMSEAGFIAFLAIERGGELIGWLTAACKAEQFMQGLLGQGRPALDFELFDGVATEPQSLLYSTAGIDAQRGPVPLGVDVASSLNHRSRISMASREWTVRYRAPASFFLLSEQIAPWLVAVGGVLATLLFFAVARAGAEWRAQAEALRLAESAVRHQATHDPLTGLANRVLFMERLQPSLERAHRRGQRLALIYLDIDGFKPVNDTHGHHVGDALLKQIARRLEVRLRREDTAARLGGDEFAMILEAAVMPAEEAERIGDGLIHLLKQPYEISSGGKTLIVQVGASVGIAHFPEHGRDADSLIIAADTAMYQAKRGGGNRCVLAGSGA